MQPLFPNHAPKTTPSDPLQHPPNLIERLAHVVTVLQERPVVGDHTTDAIASLYAPAAVFLHRQTADDAIPTTIARTLPIPYRHQQIQGQADQLALLAVRQPKEIHVDLVHAPNAMTTAQPNPKGSELAILTVIGLTPITDFHHQHQATLQILACLVTNRGPTPTGPASSRSPLFTETTPDQNRRHETRNQLAILAGYAHLLRAQAANDRQRASVDALLDHVHVLQDTLTSHPPAEVPTLEGAP